ncbi:valyl-tRNA synthetase [Aeropyrum pernix K1]|uniref:Valine--tRNA ligase n=1 Tax=Aeropyrum pernix (strain ATCC 700893 / DSM 11879 / JCM 9820 / NBRC 100138 / K1) TaxID=272557 RepID=SYV_AERPE|nr:valine--tRNA ligase [Aeropyrum pernix]Q9YAZ0.3 RecName: Full=Valine--tRNA ligase; AltName: Full=Valyl-tRNA synthetase; Short=ValRS [Aeropyrum pernix K1]BAA80808.2 valyl-tRNA synthetase [Aeropyrum pernix K1]
MGEEFKPAIQEKRWDIGEEEKLLSLWDAEDLHKSTLDPDDPREIVVIDTPPPYPSGKWHVGGAAHYTQIDMIARYFRLKGYNVVAPFYADRNGLPVEVQVEKTYGVVAHEMARTTEGRERFLALCSEFLDKVESEIVQLWRRLGCGFDYWREGTDSPRYRSMTQATFIDLWRRGLIYEAERPVRWCPRCKTTLAEAEIEHKEDEDFIYYVKYRLEEDGRDLVVATTRPELLAGCAALAYHPEDERYKGLAGKTAIAPLYGHRVKIVEHPAVKKDFGTGLMMICSYGDEEDVRLFLELDLKPKVLIDENGVMNENAGPIAGLPVKEARRRIAEILEREGLLVKKERIVHSVPVCWRCKTPLQIIHRRELFLRQLDFKDAVKQAAAKMDFKPEMHRKKLYDWIDSIKMDWPISRERFYGTEIPLWTCEKCGAKLVPEPGRYYRPWAEEPPWDSCPRCGAPRRYLKGETRVFDTWFDSSISPLYVTRWMWDKRFYERASRNVLRPQGQDIIRTWLYYSILRVLQLTGKPAFRWVRITGLGLDPKGRPMHKSLGNVIDPEPIIAKYGGDAFRFWAAIAAKLGYDYRFDENKVKTGRNFATKLWNLARFVSSFPRPEGSPLEKATEVDKAFLALADEYLEAADKAYGELDVYEPANLIYELAWDIFASHYVELVKERSYNRSGLFTREEQEAAWATLHELLRRILVALSPIMPFVTDAIHRRLYGSSVHRQRWPDPLFTPEERRELAGKARLIVSVNKAVWNLKRSMGKKLYEPLDTVEVLVPSGIESARRDLEALHKAAIRTYTGAPPEGSEEAIPGSSVYYIAKKS